ncbi:hypothetical protein CCE01nite_22150 [Cellulomonas cellasea]|uniref:Uncharacterized protein n=1 Tax=Cellulomonas cellasea TaxID=43670 RepID=A0A4Y3KXW2_9CELL|nr:hypothetical protein CCE01nite_22150 [Cellulomonas cellasea]
MHDGERVLRSAEPVEDRGHLLHVLEVEAGGVGEVEVAAGHAVDEQRDAVRVVGRPDDLDGARGDADGTVRPPR